MRHELAVLEPPHTKQHNMDIASNQLLLTEHAAPDHDNLERVSAGSNTTQNHDTLATQFTMSQPTGNAVNTVINTVSHGIPTEPVWC